MKIHLIIIAIAVTGFFSCKDNASETANNKGVQHDTIKTENLFEKKKDDLIQNGEYIQHYKTGVIEMRGMMKDGKRDGVWKSYYEDGSPWSETTYTDGKKNGKTITWYGKEKKRYEGFFTNDKESGSWTFWDEKGTVQATKKY